MLPLLAAEATAGAEVRAAAGRVLRGARPAEALAEAAAPEWRLCAAAWALAEESGAPLAPALERIAGAARDVGRVRERRAVLLAGPRMTVRLVAALPPLALALSAALGFDPLPVLLGPRGLLLAASGGALLALGIAWARRMTEVLEREDRATACELELVWIVLTSGAAPAEARRRVADCVDALGVGWVRFDDLRRGALLDTVLERGAALGAPLGPLLLEEAAAARARRLSEMERAAERLGVRVLVPLGVCVLPSFVVLGVIPVLIAMLGGAG